MDDRLFHARLGTALADLAPAAVLGAVGDDGPAVVAPRLDHVELVAALRAVLVGPQFAGLRMEGEPLHVAVAEAPDLGQGSGAADEGIVGGHPPVRLDAHQLAVVVAERLRIVALTALAEAHEEPAVAREQQARAEVHRARGLGSLAKDHLQLAQAPLQAVEIEARACHRGAVGAAGDRLDIAQVDPMVDAESRIERNVEQAALADRVDGRPAADRRSDLASRIDDPQPAGALGHEHPQFVVGPRQEGEAPGVRKPVRQRHGPGRLSVRRGGGQRAQCQQHRTACASNHHTTSPNSSCSASRYWASPTTWVS